MVSAEDLFHEIWKDEYYNKTTNTITTHIRHLREKMNDAENPKYIKTVWGEDISRMARVFTNLIKNAFTFIKYKSLM